MWFVSTQPPYGTLMPQSGRCPQHHSHQPKIETKNGTLFFNPGSAGPRRFRLPITVGRMTAEYGKLRAEIVELSVER